ncbi:MAG: type II toxin-antitoxin system RelE/ParE family toxin [Lachnospiraceae bacterium]|nr:type II toxin-antitoxin system RelE/ParE family toxin [Lachnospiraceae bacterium]
MTKFVVEFYEDMNGNCPVENFLLKQDIKMRAKLLGLLEILQEKGNQLREPYSKYLGNDIFELRGKQGNNISRILYFFYCDGKIILTNGFVKKTQKTPVNELRLAQSRRNDYLERRQE